MGQVSAEPERNMFQKKWWPFREVRSDDGFVVHFIGLRKGIEYREGEHVFRLEVERAPHNWIVYAQSVKQLFASGETKSVSEDVRKRITTRVRSALNFLKIDFVMDD